MTTIIVDADYLDRVAFEITVNFERMLERRVDRLDLSRWVDYVSLDAGLRPGDEKEVQVVLLYPDGKETLKNCMPSHLDTELNGTAVKTNISEFMFASIKAEKELVELGSLFAESLRALLSDEKTERIVLVPDTESYGNLLREALLQAKPKQQITLFAPEAQTGFRCMQENVQYSLMAAMGIRGEELG